MATFDFTQNAPAQVLGSAGNLDPRRLREECIIAFKVYDACRHPGCKHIPLLRRA